MMNAFSKWASYIESSRCYSYKKQAHPPIQPPRHLLDIVPEVVDADTPGFIHRHTDGLLAISRHRANRRRLPLVVAVEVHHDTQAAIQVKPV